jgi:hypothetical protein
MNGRRRVEADKRRRTETSCDVCKSRKQKCDRQLSLGGVITCRYCKAHDLSCATTQPRKQRVYGSLEHVGMRIRLLEAITKGLVPEANLSSNDELRRLGTSLGIPLPPDLEHVADGPPSRLIPTGGTATVEKTLALPLLPDQQGHIQYTGPASSFSFHSKLGSLFDTHSKPEFVMFGPNAAPLESNEKAILPDPAVSNELVQAFFAHAHASFPILHETSFRATFEAWLYTNNKDEPNACWMVTLLCVWILGSKVGPQQISAEQETTWWQQVQLHLPTILFTTDMAALQALMLVALYLHHASHRDACWNIVGAVVRIAHAIGLHSDDATAQLPPLLRELRKSTWWNLLAFEQLLVSSLDRPSAVDVLECGVSPPDERILGLMNPPEYSKWSTRLVQLLGSACRARTSYGPISKDETLGPLSPALSALRELQRWKELLPKFLQPEATDTTAPCYVRPILVLQAQYHYAVVVLTRAILLEHATTVSKGLRWTKCEGPQTLSDECRTSGASLCRALLKMHGSDCFDSVTGFDMFYGITGASILVLEIVIMHKQGSDHTETSTLLQKIAMLAEKHLRNRKMPDTLRKWATLISELSSMTRKFCSCQREESVVGSAGEKVATHQTLAISDAQLLMGLQQTQTMQVSAAEQSSFYLGVDGMEQQHHNIDPSLWMDSTHVMNAERSLSTSEQQWQWEDIEAILNR